MVHDHPPKTQEAYGHDVTRYRKTGASMSMTVPKSVRELLKWEDGEILIVSVFHGALVVMSAKTRMIQAAEEYVKETERIC